MSLSCSRLIRPGLILTGVFAFAAVAVAAPPPGMRWGDHSGLSPSGGRSRPATPSYPRLAAPPVVSSPAPSSGATTYYYPPRGYSSVPAPGVTWYYYPTRPSVIYSPSAPVVTGPAAVTPSATPSVAPPILILPSR